MDNLIFCLNATLPVFLLMVLGYVFKRLGVISDEFAGYMNSFVFKVSLPVLVFQDLSRVDFFAYWKGSYVLFCFIATVLSILVAVILSLFIKEVPLRGEFAQASYRSSSALLGISFIMNIYGDSGMAPLMIIGSVPLYNMMAVILLHVTNAKAGEADIKGTLKGIITNPIIDGIIVGVLWSLLGLPQPVIFQKTVSHLAALTTPMGLMALGASFNFQKVSDRLAPVLGAVFLKLVAYCAIFLPVAVYMGFRNDELVAALVMLGSPTTVAAYVMARGTGHEGSLSSGCIMLTTLLSAFTLTGWLYILRVMGFV